VTAESGARVRVTAEVVRELLSDAKIFPDLPADLADDAEIALDSLGLVWFLHQLDLRLGLAVDPDEAQLAAFTSIRRITDYLVGVDEP
jgi:acyl carrier protein